MQTVRWEFYPLVAHNSVTRAFIEELAQVRRSSSTIDNYSRDLEDFLQAFTDLPFPAVLEADAREQIGELVILLLRPLFERMVVASRAGELLAQEGLRAVAQDIHRRERKLPT